MRAQLHGIMIALIVHGTAAFLLYGLSQGITPPIKTVVLDFSFESGAMEIAPSTGPEAESPPGGSGSRPILAEEWLPVPNAMLVAETLPPADEEATAGLEMPPAALAVLAPDGIPSEGSSLSAGGALRGEAAEESSGIVGATGGDRGSAYLDKHFNFIRGHLREHLCYPSLARKRGWSGEVMVAFTIHPDGSADDIEIQKSCGISLLDRSALKTVSDACPFPRPPIVARIVVPIVYELE